MVVRWGKSEGAQGRNLPERRELAAGNGLASLGLMRAVLLSAVLMVSGACVGPQPGAERSDELTPSTQPPTLTAAAEVENGLAYDGCSYEVTISGVSYAPSPASLPRVQAFAQAIGTTVARVEYVVTGGTAQVECGWGSKQTFPEIEVVSISAP
jgi:hypothetical protein